MLKREDRRDRTMRYGRKAQKVHLRAIHPTGNIDCVCEKSVWFFAKGKSLGCHCSKRRHGAPKSGTGPCLRYHVREAVVQRISDKRICKRWLNLIQSGTEPNDVEL